MSYPIVGVPAQIAGLTLPLPDAMVDGKPGHWYADESTRVQDSVNVVPHPGKVEDCPTCNPVPVVGYEPGDRMSALHLEYYRRKAAKEAAEADLKAVVDAIKLALTEAAPDQPKVRLEGPSGRPLTLSYVTSWRVSTPKLKANYPEVYAICASESGSWRLEAAKGGAD